jgi:hypothetical protein
VSFTCNRLINGLKKKKKPTITKQQLCQLTTYVIAQISNHYKTIKDSI